jgi:hypothetical protein
MRLVLLCGGLLPIWLTIFTKSLAQDTPSPGTVTDPTGAIIPNAGFYEWKRMGTAKQPYCLAVNKGELFAFAGIWDGWKNATKQWFKTCSPLTTNPETLTSSLQ